LSLSPPIPCITLLVRAQRTPRLSLHTHSRPQARHIARWPLPIRT
jgi:hypothetical protein